MDIIGAKIKHLTKYGDGIIIKVVNSTIEILFAGDIVKQFGLNEDFDKYFYVYDDETKRHIDELILKNLSYKKGKVLKNKQQAEQSIISHIDKLLEKQHFDEKPINYCNHGDSYSSNSQEIYLRICKALKKFPSALADFGMEGAPLYAKLSKDYSLWCIPYPQNFKPTALDIKFAKSQYWDVVYDDSIIEIFLKKDMEPEYTQRLTFVRYDGIYEFYGVFQVYQQQKRERTFYRIADKFDILKIKHKL